MATPSAIVKPHQSASFRRMHTPIDSQGLSRVLHLLSAPVPHSPADTLEIRSLRRARTQPQADAPPGQAGRHVGRASEPHDPFSHPTRVARGTRAAFRSMGAVWSLSRLVGVATVRAETSV
jgi:hypothetical protein